MEILGGFAVVVGALLSLVGLACSIVILIDAFQDEVWKGILFLVCGLYGIYYALVEFEHDKKILIVCGSLLGLLVGNSILLFGLRQFVRG